MMETKQTPLKLNLEIEFTERELALISALSGVSPLLEPDTLNWAERTLRRALKTAGHRDELLGALREITCFAEVVHSVHHSGLTITAAMWDNLNQATNAARAAIARAEKNK